ncbi:hypothetical protein QCC31_24860, partial [Pseudomonas aeruginosa]|nr:hypothetical protein [Pseudomonas aeruginosa]
GPPPRAALPKPPYTPTPPPPRGRGGGAPGAPPRAPREQASLANQLRQALAQGDGERLAGLTRLLFEGNLGAQGDTV